MSEHTPEGDVARLTDKEIELREWLRSQPGGAERWTVVKAGFRRSYDMGMRDSLNTRPDAEKDAGACGGSIPVEHTLGALPDHCSTCAEYDGPRRRTEAEARRCSQEGCPGDGRYQPPGRGHLPGCEHNAVRWVWEEINKQCSCGWDKPLGPKCLDCGGLTVWKDTSVTSPGGSDV